STHPNHEGPPTMAWIEPKEHGSFRVRWYTGEGKKTDGETFAQRVHADQFQHACRVHGAVAVAAAFRTRHDPADPAPLISTGPAAPATVAGLPALAGGRPAPVPSGVSFAWVADQYASTRTKANERTVDDIRRDLNRFVYPYFGTVDIALVMRNPL